MPPIFDTADAKLSAVVEVLCQQERRCRDNMQFGRADEWRKHAETLKAALRPVDESDLATMRERICNLYAEAERLEAVADALAAANSAGVA